jgi:Amt family ammonium transporter
VDPDEMVFHMNNDLNDTKTGGMFVTSIVGEYNLITDEIRWVNAGHQPAIIRNDNGEYNQIDSSAPPLGVVKQKNKSIYNINKMKLNGSRFYAFTDGLSESLDEEGKEIGIDGSINIIEQNYNKDTSKQLDDITKSVVGDRKNQTLTDDLTLISIGK